MEEKVFSMVPGPPSSALWLWVFVVFLVALALFFAWQTYSMNNIRFEVSPRGLRIKAPMYGRFIPSSDVKKEEARILNLGSEQNYRPTMRTNGIALPGYVTGWYRLKNKEKALLFVTDRSAVVYIPTSEGFSILASAQDAQGFLNALTGK
jgi:hypothetical protein